MTTLDFTTLVQNQVVAIRSLANSAIDFTVGSVLRAIIESNSSVVIWLQSLILQILLKTRAATSFDDDLDSWMADFNIFREPAIYATGVVTFSRFTAIGTALIPIGTLIESTDGKQTYVVTLDSTNNYYDIINNGYTIPDGISSIDLPIIALTKGSIANAVIGFINVLTQSIPGVDAVTNATALINGVDAETDEALRYRFILYIASLSRGTIGAVAYAIISLQQGLIYTIEENYDYNGTLDRGFFYAVIDDGTGIPSDAIVTDVTNAIELMRPICSTFEVHKPSIVHVTWSMAVTVVSGDTITKTNILNNINNYINALRLEEPLPYTKLIQLAYDTSPNVLNVASVLLNSATSDISANNKQVIKVTSGTVT